MYCFHRYLSVWGRGRGIHGLWSQVPSLVSVGRGNTPPPDRTGVTPPPSWIEPGRLFGAGGMPLAFALEDFLVIYLHTRMVNIHCDLTGHNCQSCKTKNSPPSKPYNTQKTRHVPMDGIPWKEYNMNWQWSLCNGMEAKLEALTNPFVQLKYME